MSLSAALAAKALAAGPVYVNSDAWNFWLDPKMGAMSREELKRAVEADVEFYAVKGVTAVFYNMNFQRCFFPTRAGTPYWKDVSLSEKGDLLLRGRPVAYGADERAAGDPDAEYRTMFQSVTNMVKTFPEFMSHRYAHCRRLGMEMWHSFRVNDVHYSSLGLEWRPQHGDLWLDGKDCVRAWYRHGWRTEWSDNALDYGNDRVYASQLGVVREYLTDYPSDGLEFDWLRAAPVFKPGFDDFHRDRLTQFVRDARRIADAAERKWGRRIRFAHRVPARVRDAQGLGLDVARWAREGLADVLMPGGTPATTTEQDCDVALYRALAPRPVVIAAEIDCSVSAQRGWRVSIDDRDFGNEFDAGFASSFYQQGADGIYFYNHFPRHGRRHPWVREFFTQASDRATVAKMARRHPATRHVRCGESRRDESPFPPAIWPRGGDGGVNICCGEGNAGRPARVVIGATAAIDVDVLVNTVPCGRATETPAPAGCPAGPAKATYYAVAIPAGTLHDGFNSIELFNRGEDVIPDARLVWMEVEVSD